MSVFPSGLFAIGLIPYSLLPLTASISHTPQFGQEPYLQSGIIRLLIARLFSSVPFSGNLFSPLSLQQEFEQTTEMVYVILAQMWRRLQLCPAYLYHISFQYLLPSLRDQ